MATIEIKGGDKLAAALSNIARNLESAASVRIGFLEGATYPDGTPVALVATVQNFGAPSRGIPPRPFFSNMVKDKSPAWPKAIAQNLVATKYNAKQTLGQVGEGIKGQLQDAIRDFAGPPLSPDTVKAKGFDKQLIDTGHMLNSVGYDVE